MGSERNPTVDHGEPSDQPARGRGVTLAVVAAIVACVVGVVVIVQRDVPTSTRPPRAAVTERPSPPPDPNDEWFTHGGSGTQMAANEIIDDPDMYPLYLDDAEAEVYSRHGVRRVRMRSYYAGAAGGAAIKLVETDDPQGVLTALDRLGDGLGRPYPGVPDGHMRSNVVQMESTRAHDVFAHFYTVTFVDEPFVVTVEAYATTDAVGRRRAVSYARRQHQLLAARARAG